MNCPSCGLENPADARYCDDCGAVLGEAASEAAARAALLEPGACVGPFKIESSTQRGAFNVYDATRTDDGRQVRLIEDAEAPPRPEADADEPADEPDPKNPSKAALVWRALHGIDNEHLWPVESFLYAERRAFVAGSPVPQGTLQQHLEETQALEPDEVRAVGLSLLDALQALHARGFLHMGLHPSNVLVDDDGHTVLEGYDRLVDMKALPAMYSVLEGWSAPEAYGIGEAPSAASDVFSVGATLYNAISRRVPHEVTREQFFLFPPLSRQVPDVPRDLERIVMKALSKQPAARYASAQEMAEELENASMEKAEVAVPAMAMAGAGTHSSAPPPRSEPAAAPRSTVSTTQSPKPQGFLPVKVGMLSDVGKVRAVNQDSMLVMTFAAVERSMPTTALLVIVADGMGGEAEGDKASSLAIRAMATHVLKNHIPILTGNDTTRLRANDPVERLQDLLREAMAVANQTIYGYSLKDRSRRGMGSTLTALMIDWPHAVFGHAGDTRAYLLRSDLDQVTEDHSLVGKLVRLGQLTREEARHSPQRSYLYRAMGTGEELEVDVYARSLEPGDRLLICSDGVWEYFTDEEIVGFLSLSDDPQKDCEKLVEEVLRRGADDNCTAVILHVPQETQGRN